MQTNRTKLTEEELNVALSMYKGVCTVLIKHDLERIINYAYDLGAKSKSVKRAKRSDDKLD